MRIWKKIPFAKMGNLFDTTSLSKSINSARGTNVCATVLTEFYEYVRCLFREKEHHQLAFRFLSPVPSTHHIQWNVPYTIESRNQYQLHFHSLQPTVNSTLLFTCSVIISLIFASELLQNNLFTIPLT